MIVSLTRNFLIFILLGITNLLYGQEQGFDSFISRISRDYKVDIALAPELIPTLDSIINTGQEIPNLEVLLHQLFKHSEISYQVIDGNKLMLRRESPYQEGSGLKLLKGMIVDGHDGAPLPFAAVTLMETNRGSYTDENGIFNIAVNDTTGKLMISYLGFKSMTIPISAFNGDMYKVRMELSTIPLKQVVIVVPFQQMSSNEATQSIDLKGYQVFSSEELLNGNAEQLINVITAYTHFSSDKGIRIRGSEEENSLVLMDGLPVYDPYHFYNIFGPFNGHYFSSVSIYKNNMPVEYGGRIDGLISLDSDHDTPGSKLILDTDLLLTSLTGDLALSKKVRITGGGRVSHTAMLNNALSDSSVANFSVPGKFKDENEYASLQQPTFNFYDINLGFRAGIGKESEMKISYFRNQDHQENSTTTNLETTLVGLPGIPTMTVEQQIESVDKWGNEGISLDFHSPLWNKAKFNLNGFVSSFDKSSAYDSYRLEERPGMTRTSANTGNQENELESVGIKAFISANTVKGSGYKIGADLQHHEIDLLATENNSPYLIESQQEIEATLFGEYHFTPLEKLDMTLGGRLTYLNSTTHIYPQPHVSINYFIDDQWILKSSFSKNIQSIQALTIENRFGREIDFLALSQPEAGYAVLKSDKYMIGSGYTSDNLSIDGEIFYKKIDGLMNVRALKPDPSFNDMTSPGEFYRLFTGDGWTAGFDLLAVYKIKDFDCSVSYTLSKITERSDQLFNGNSFSPKEDRRHQVKLAGQYRFGKFTASSLLTYKSKAPYLSLVRLEGGDGIGMVDQGNVFRYLPPWFSLDLGLDYSFEWLRNQAQVGISLINATNHENVSDLQHIGKVSRDEGMHGLFLIQETALLSRTVNLHFRYLID